MMANTGALIGILVIGGAGMAYAISKQKKTTTLPPPGGVHYTPPTNGGSGIYSDHLELMACTKCNHSPEYCNCGGG